MVPTSNQNSRFAHEFPFSMRNLFQNFSLVLSIPPMQLHNLNFGSVLELLVVLELNFVSLHAVPVLAFKLGLFFSHPRARVDEAHRVLFLRNRRGCLELFCFEVKPGVLAFHHFL